MNLSTVLRAMCEFAKKMLLPINALVVNQPNSTQHSSAFTISMQLNTCCRFRTLDLTYSLCLTSFAGETLGIRWDGMGFRARVGRWDEETSIGPTLQQYGTSDVLKCFGFFLKVSGY